MYLRMHNWRPSVNGLPIVVVTALAAKLSRQTCGTIMATTKTIPTPTMMRKIGMMATGRNGKKLWHWLSSLSPQFGASAGYIGNGKLILVKFWLIIWYIQIFIVHLHRETSVAGLRIGKNWETFITNPLYSAIPLSCAATT